MSFGKTMSLGFEYNVAIKCEEHVLVSGGSGSGKSSNVVIPTVYSWDDPMFVIDIKSEVSAAYEKSGNKRPFIKFDPLNENCLKYDPFENIRKLNQENIVSLITEIAYSIIPDENTQSDSFWIESERNLLIGSLIHYYYIGYDFSTAIYAIQTTALLTLLDEIEEQENQYAIMFVKNMRKIKIEILSSIATGLSNKIMIFATDPFISRVFGKDDDGVCFDWSDIETHNIFICIPADKIETWSAVIRIMTNQLFRYLDRRPEKHSEKGKDQKQILLLLDEFASIGKLNIIKPLSTIRSKSVTIALFIQSIAQLDYIYGADARKIIVDNCGYKVFLKAQDVDTQNYMSDAVGSYFDGAINLPIIPPAYFRTLEKILVLTPKDRFLVTPYPYYEKHKEEENEL